MAALEKTPSCDIFKEDLFKDQVWIVTGGGTGIGLEIAIQAAKLGAHLAICGRRKEPLEEASKAIKSHKDTCRVFYETCDTRNSESVQAFIEAVLSEFKAIHVLINNGAEKEGRTRNRLIFPFIGRAAGGQYVTRAEHLVPKGFDAVIKNNLSGTWNFIYYCAKLAFIPQGYGSIINIIAQIKRGFPGMLHTGAARAGVENLTKTLAVEWSKYGIRTNAIAPGVIESTGTTKYTPEFLSAAIKSAPLQRLGSVQEVCHLVCFLASPKSAGFITGQTYYVDGGQSLGREIWSLPKL